MRVLLRSRKNSLFVGLESGWTGDIGAARDFVSSLEALGYAAEQRLEGVEVVLWFGDPQFDIILPVDGARQGLRIRPQL